MARRINWEEARRILRKLREEQVRDGDMVVQLWENVLIDYTHKLGDELWQVYEQVCVAALDCRKLDMADACIEALLAQFPKSIRVQRLQGMLVEAEGRYEKAEEIYTSILEEDPTNMFVRKRQVAILKAQGKYSEAIEKINKYLDKFMTDYEAWMELCDLYITEHDYMKAAFCMEELIMSNPHNHLYHQKFADIHYTMGGEDNMKLARSYYSQAVKLNPNNIRALYGMFLSSVNLATVFAKTKSSHQRQDSSKYAAWAAEQITILYKSSQTEEQLKETRVLESIEKTLESLQTWEY